MFSIGDQVAVLDDTLRGIIIGIDNQLVNIKGVDGMIYQYHQRELVIIQQEQHQLSKYSDINHPLLKEKLVVKKKKESNFKKEKKEVILEIDLHINQLIKSHKGMSNFEILTLQLETAKKNIEFAISKRISKIVFIHGVGEGVLKNELHYLLGRYPTKFYDASYKKYGLGATEVHIYQNSNEF